MARFHFKNELKHDIALLTETQSVSPYLKPENERSKLWEMIATNLSNSTLQLPVSGKGRTCQRRVEKLLGEFKKEERLSLKASGINEADMDSIKSLLTSLASLENIKLTLKSDGKRKKEMKDLANEIRDRALVVVETTDVQKVDLENGGDTRNKDNPSTTEIFMDGLSTPAVKKVEVNESHVDVVGYLQSKNEAERKIKLEELKVRTFEAENRKIQPQLQKEKQDADIKQNSNMTKLIEKLLQERAAK